MSLVRRRSLGAAALVLAGLTACAPSLPRDVDPEALKEAISASIGDQNTCVLIAPSGSDRAAFRYNSAITCARVLPACAGTAQRTLQDLLAQTAKGAAALAISCPSSPDGGREVAWAAGPVAGRPLIYAAVMEGERALPGRIVAERLARAFKDAGL